MHLSTKMSHAGIIFDADSELKSDFQDFDFLLFLGIKSESNQYSLFRFIFIIFEWERIGCSSLAISPAAVFDYHCWSSFLRQGYYSYDALTHEEWDPKTLVRKCQKVSDRKKWLCSSCSAHSNWSRADFWYLKLFDFQRFLSLKTEK